MFTSLLPLCSSMVNMGTEEECGKSCGARKCESKKLSSTNADVIIIGAGVAGSALAHTLGKDGLQVHLIERNLAEPNRIVGEVLQPGGYLKLIELGLEDCVNEIDAQKVLGYAVYKNGKSIRLPYPLEKFHFDAAGRSFHHGRFIRRLREKVASLANVKMEQGTVISLIEERGTIKGVEYKKSETTGHQQYLKAYAPLTIVCDGSFSNLRSFLCKPKVEMLSNFISLVMENCELPYPNHGLLILEGPSFMSLYPISSTEVRFFIDFPATQTLPSISNGEMAHYLKTMVAPKIPPEACSAFMSSIDKGEIRKVAINSMSATPYLTPGAVLLGDALNIRHPVTGAGMMVALHDIVLLRDLLRPLYKQLTDTTALTKCLELFYTLRKPVAYTANTVADGLFKLSSCGKAKENIQQLGFEYLSLGQFFSRGPMAIFSGLDLHPLSLAFHYAAMSIYATARFLLQIPSPKRMWASSRLLWGASAIVFPFTVDGVKELFFITNLFQPHLKAPPVINGGNEGQTSVLTRVLCVGSSIVLCLVCWKMLLLSI